MSEIAPEVTRVVVVEDQPLFRSMLELTLGATEGVRVVASVGTVKEGDRKSVV